MAEFEVGGFQFRSGRMNAFTQFHVARKLAPVLAKLAPGSMQVKSEATMADLLGPVIHELAAMSEEDCDYILHKCLSVVQRLQGHSGGGPIWAPIWNEPAKRLMFEDIDVQLMMQITLEVLGDNLGGFIGAPTSTSPPQPSVESGTRGNSSASPTEKTG